MIANEATKVSEKELFFRIREHLAEQNPDQRFVKAEGRDGTSDLFYLLDKNGHFIKSGINLEGFGRELGVLKPWETVVKEID